MKSVGILVQFEKLIRATIENTKHRKFNKNTNNIIFWSFFSSLWYLSDEYILLCKRCGIRIIKNYSQNNVN